MTFLKKNVSFLICYQTNLPSSILTKKLPNALLVESLKILLSRTISFLSTRRTFCKLVNKVKGKRRKSLLNYPWLLENNSKKLHASERKKTKIINSFNYTRRCKRRTVKKELWVYWKYSECVCGKDYNDLWVVMQLLSAQMDFRNFKMRLC